MEQQTIDVAQTMMPAIGAGGIVFFLVLYVLWALCLALIAKKIGRDFGTSFVMALIPIANLVLICQMAGKPVWWFILFFVPIVNIVIAILIWMAICEARGKPGWWGVIMVLIPIVNLVMFLILAFGREGTGMAPASPSCCS